MIEVIRYFLTFVLLVKSASRELSFYYLCSRLVRVLLMNVFLLSLVFKITEFDDLRNTSRNVHGRTPKWSHLTRTVITKPGTHS
jgi:hypothetical protein